MSEGSGKSSDGWVSHTPSSPYEEPADISVSLRECDGENERERDRGGGRATEKGILRGCDQEDCEIDN